MATSLGDFAKNFGFVGSATNEQVATQTLTQQALNNIYWSGVTTSNQSVPSNFAAWTAASPSIDNLSLDELLIEKNRIQGRIETILAQGKALEVDPLTKVVNEEAAKLRC